MTGDDRTTVIQRWLDQLNAGNDFAREALFASTFNRLSRLTRKMLKGFRGVARWEQSDDILQNALIRLDRSLRAVSPQTAKEFFALAATQIRRELIDMARRYGRDRAFGARQVALDANGGHSGEVAREIEPANTTYDPANLAEWTEFHAQIESMAEADRELFDLLWYHGLSQAEAGNLLGVSERTINKRWIAARLRLAERLNGRLPD